jgi:hypothetical protein
MDDAKTLYDEDFFAWSKQQAKALRAAARTGSNQLLDWENLAEEVEDLGKSERRTLGSQILRIVEHLAKLEHSPATDPRAGWRSSIRDARDEIDTVLDESPSLRSELAPLISRQMARGICRAIAELQDRGEIGSVDLPGLRRSAYTADQILGDWFPPEP